MAEWGSEIAVNGMRPDWLRSEIGLFENRPEKWLEGCKLISWAWTTNSDGVCPIAIRLPADHPYYTVQRYNEQHGTSFVYWPGGDAAPGDWDGDRTLKRKGHLAPTRISDRADWQRGYNGDVNNMADLDIIGYTRRIEPKRDTVTVERRTEAEWIDLIGPPHVGDEQSGVLRVLRYLQVILPLSPEPTEAQRITAETGVPVEMVERVLSARTAGAV